MKNIIIRIVLVSVLLLISGIVHADVLHYDDVITTGSHCVGFDCANGESFGYDTIKLKENNLQFFFDDTSTGSFPANDWRIVINDTTSGGANYFAIQDATNSRTPFKIEANAPANSLYVEDYGRVGLGTAIPYVELHIVDGDSPTVRLDQDGSSGWAAQSWDVCGNETNFFIRDVTNGSKLCFRIQPNTPSNTLCLRNTGNVGIGTWSPEKNLHILDDSADNSYVTPVLIEAQTDDYTGFRLKTPTDAIDFNNADGEFRLNFVNTGAPGPEFRLNNNGDIIIKGSLTTASTTYADYVFEDNYPLMSLPDLNEFIEKEGHLPNMASADEVKQAGGINMTDLQIKLLEKVEELTLYTLQQQAMIDDLKKEIHELKR